MPATLQNSMLDTSRQKARHLPPTPLQLSNVRRAFKVMGRPKATCDNCCLLCPRWHRHRRLTINRALCTHAKNVASKLQYGTPRGRSILRLQL